MPRVSVLPDIEIEVFESSATPRRKRYGFAISDVMGDLLHLGAGASIGTMPRGYDQNANEWDTASPHSAFDVIDNLDFIRFGADGRVHEGVSAPAGDFGKSAPYSGWILKSEVVPTDNKTGATSLTAGNTASTWTGLAGQWGTVLPPRAPYATCLQNTGAEETAKIKSPVQPANGGMECEVIPHGSLNFDSQPYARATWGAETYSIILPHGGKPRFEMKVNGEWQLLRTFDNQPPVDLESRVYKLRARRVAGRIVVSVNGDSLYYYHSHGADPKAVSWPEGEWTCEVKNLRATVKPQPLRYVSSGTLGRTVPVTSPYDPSSSTEPQHGGWQSDNAGINTTISATSSSAGYTTTMTSSDGIDTPVLNKLIVPFAPSWVEWTSEEDYSSIDLRKALKMLSVDLSMPPTASGAEARIELSRAMLDRYVPGWEDYVQKKRRVRIRIRRRYSDGTCDAQWTHVFDGAIYKINKSTDGPNSNTMAIIARDGSMFLQKKFSVIDYRDAPLDYLISDYRDNGLGGRSLVYPNGHKIYGVDFVYEILKRHVGPAEAARLNGGYPENKLRFFNSHYPLVDTANPALGYLAAAAAMSLGSVPLKDGVLFPPPFDEDAMAWIGEFKKHDHAEFFYGHPDTWNADPAERAASYPAPIYGRILNFIAPMPVTVVTDTEYLDGDLELLMHRAATETRPDKDMNRALVIGRLADETKPFMRRSLIGEARVPTAHTTGYADGTYITVPYANSAEQIGELTEVFREELATVPGVAQMIANSIIRLVTGIDMQAPDVTLRGNPGWYWGDKVQFKMQGTYSDTSIGLSGHTFRVERVTHTVNVESEDPTQSYTTGLMLSPMTAVG